MVYSLGDISPRQALMPLIVHSVIRPYAQRSKRGLTVNFRSPLKDYHCETSLESKDLAALIFV